MALREYQLEGKQDTSDALVEHQAVILCMPTGSGKTVTFADMARDAVANGYPTGILVDRKELLDQAKKKLIEYGLNPTIVTAGRRMKLERDCYVFTVQTLKRRTFPEIKLLIVDEAHKQIFDPVVKIFKEAGTYIIGATATPKRTGKMNQLADMYGAIVEPVKITDLIQQGYLVPAISFGAKMDLSKIKTKGDDFDTDELYKAFDRPTLYAGAVDKYKKFARGTKAIVFCINVEHSQKTAAAFRAAGINAVHVDGNTHKRERERILEAYSMGIIEVLTNVDILTTGYDEWTIQTVIVNLATKSYCKWKQMGGRGSRITPKELQGRAGYLQKDHFNLIDMGGNIPRLGFWEDEVEYSLTHKTKETLDAAPVKQCDDETADVTGRFGCGALVHLTVMKCKHCGYLFPEKEKPKPLETEFALLENKSFLPESLIFKSIEEMDVQELEDYKNAKGYKNGWLLRQIALHQTITFLDYAYLKNYNNPEAWVARMEAMYLPKTETVYKYFYHADSDSVFKKQGVLTEMEENNGVVEVTYEEYLALLHQLEIPDNDDLILKY